MKSFANCLKKFWSADDGGEVIEYALVMGLIAIVCITAIGVFGGKVLDRWNFFNTGMGN